MTASISAVTSFLPIDRVRSIAQNLPLPKQTQGAALFIDISGYTVATKAFRNILGPKKGSEALTQKINAIFDTLILVVY